MATSKKDQLETLKKTFPDWQSNAAIKSQVEKLEAEISKEQETGTEFDSMPSASDDEYIDLPVTEDEYNESTSLFPRPGIHPLVAGLPMVEKNPKTGNINIKWAFIPDEGCSFTNEQYIWTGQSKEAAWKTREILDVLGVKHETGPKGNVRFQPAQIPGKKIMGVFVAQGMYTDPITGETRPSNIAKLDRIEPRQV